MSEPAFPLMETRVHMDEGKLQETGIYLIHPGLSKLEWYAGMAMQGILACPEASGSITSLTDYAFRCAEAMLKEAEKHAIPPSTL